MNSMHQKYPVSSVIFITFCFAVKKQVERLTYCSVFYPVQSILYVHISMYSYNVHVYTCTVHIIKFPYMDRSTAPIL